MMNFTKTQQSVIDIRDKNILVSAAAGSGKTAVLVERIIKIVSDKEAPIDIDRLLVLTFTNAAAAEMKERIIRALGQKLESEPQNSHLERQMTLINHAQITTIDSFCLYILRNHFHAINLDPAFRVADESELQLIKKEVISELLESRYEERSEEFLACAAYFAHGTNDRRLEELIEKLYNMAISFPWSKEWLAERKYDYQTDDIAKASPHDGLLSYLITFAEYLLQGCLEDMIAIRSVCEEPDGPYMYAATIDKEIEMLQGILGNSLVDDKITSVMVYDDLFSAWGTLHFTSLPGKRDDSVSPEKREQVKKLRNDIKETLRAMGASFFSQPYNSVAVRMAAISPAVSVLADLAIEYLERFDIAKRSRNIIDFADMEHMALAILWDKTDNGIKPSAVALELREHFVEVMTDEYQDSNLKQEMLLIAIAGDDKERQSRFMVGDVKQSIYKFRLARPELFIEKYETYPDSPDSVRIDLNQNFRSRVAVLDSVNYIFSHIMRRTLGGVEYDKEAHLVAGAKYPDNSIDDDKINQSELLLMDLSQSDRTDEAVAFDDEVEIATGATKAEQITAENDKMNPDSDIEKEARMVAHRIDELMDGYQVSDGAGGLRPLRYGDIVILMRSVSGRDEAFKIILQEEGIPVLTAARTGYFAVTEVQTVLQLISVLDNPLQDIPLFGVMKSFFGNFDDGEIALIKAKAYHGGKRKQTLYEDLLAFVSGGEVLSDVKGITVATMRALQERVRLFLGYIDKYRQKAVYVTIADLLGELIVDSGYYHDVAVREDGKIRIANLEMLMQKAAAYAETSFHGLFHFVRYIGQLEKYNIDYGEALLDDEHADVVRIMSIHKSKGLEFPVCFVTGLHKKHNVSDSRDSVCLDADLGIGVDYIDTVRRVRRPCLRRRVISRKLQLDSLGEEFRILYVAMTRAKEKLILTGVTKKPLPGESNTPCSLSYLQLFKAGSFLELLLPLITCEAAADIFRIKTVKSDELTIKAVIEAGEAIKRKEALLSVWEQKISRDSLYKELSRRFASSYQFADLAKLYAKTTVTELKRNDKITSVMQTEEGSFSFFEQLLYQEPEVVPYIPDFAKVSKDEELVDKSMPPKPRYQVGSGAERGSAYHRVMEVMNIYKLTEQYQKIMMTADDDMKSEATLMSLVAAQLENAVINRRLSNEYAEAVPLAKITAFFIAKTKEQAASGDGLSLLARRMSEAERNGCLYKEQPFVIGVAANRLHPELPPGETILIQGIIDVYFTEADGVVIIDYKSDVVTRREELIERYQKQLDYYGEALTQLTGQPIKEKIIYSFSLNEAIVV